jgi:uncharacterized protein YjbI with pentapeptide repeats
VPVFTRGEKAELYRHVFCVAELDEVDFSGADLRGARFERCSLRGAIFSGSLLIGVEFLGCDLRCADFSGAVLAKNRFDGSWLIGVAGLSPTALEQARNSGGLFLRLIQRTTKTDP